MSKKLLFKGGHATGMTPYEIEDFSSLHIRDPRIDEKTKAYIDSVIGNSVLNLCPYRNVLVTHKYDTVEGNVVTLDDCEDDEIIQLSEIQGNTMINCNKDTDKELILMPNLDTNGYSNVTLTEGIDGGKVDVALEGNTMVNVCDQEDPVAITKSYTVETGNHIALQGEYDGKCRPNIYGNTMVNIITSFDYVSMGEGNTGDGKYDYSTGSYKDVGNNLSRHLGYTVVAKPNTLYTVLANIKTNTLDNKFGLIGWGVTKNNTQVTVPNGFTGQFISTFTTTDENLQKAWATDIWKENTTGTIELDSFMILEGDYTNKPIPDYFTGMKSSFEDKLVPENLNVENLWVYSTTTFNRWQLDGQLLTSTPKTLYNGSGKIIYFEMNSDIQGTQGTWLSTTPIKPGEVKLLNTPLLRSLQLKESDGWTSSLDLTGLYIVEGDYTNYDFTDYDSTKGGKYKVDYKVTGKNKVVYSGNNPKNGINTGYNSGLEATVESDYSASIKGTNTRETDIYFIGMWNNPQIRVKGGTYTISANCNGLNVGIFYIIEKGTSVITSLQVGSNVKTTITTEGLTSVMLRLPAGTYDFNIKLQIEEGTTATTYEPYKESIKTLYLNSPLLEGDTIEQSGNNIIHNHRYGSITNKDLIPTFISLDNNNYRTDTSCACLFNFKDKTYNKPKTIMYCDKLPYYANSWSTTSVDCAICGVNNDYDFSIRLPHSVTGITTQDTGSECMEKFKTWNDNNLINIVYELDTPTQEIISTSDNLLLDSYTNGHLDVDSVVPIDKVVFYDTTFKLKYLYSSTSYTIQFESDNIGKIDYMYFRGSNNPSVSTNIVKGLNKITLKTGDGTLGNYVQLSGIGFNASKIVVTPKVDNNFGYFKGIKSVGECEGNKIEILSQNKNLLPILNLEVDNEGYANRQKTYWQNVKLKPNTKYTLSYINKTINNTNSDMWAVWVREQVGKKAVTTDNIVASTQTEISTSFTTSDKDLYEVSIISNNGDDVGSYLFKPNTVILEEGEKTSYVPYAMNKKEILLNEPLRGLPNGICDKYVIIDGKWYIERNTVEILLDNSLTDIGISGMDFADKNIQLFFIGKFKDILKRTPNNDTVPNLLSDKFNTNAYNILYKKNIEGVAITQNGEIGISVLKSKLSTVDADGLKQWLSNNNIKVICELAQPTYEPIDYNPFEIYTETTHISNNSTIPCNMVIKNTGYNCILKPNTKYTVSSSNGLSTVTTKDSIGDSVLRFYNKDTSSITKMKNVLVLEGDYITGNPPIPSFFKGMESAFEQEKITDENDEHYGKYKVTVKAVGKNLLDETKGVINSSIGNSNTICIKVKPNTTYTYSSSVYKGAIAIYKLPFIIDNGTSMQELGNMGYKEFSIVDGESFTTSSITNYIFMNYDSTSKVQIEQGGTSTEYEPYKENNITFYINEALRGVGDVKDKVYVKEDKVVVERNCGSVTFDGSDTWNLNKIENNIYTYSIRSTNFLTKMKVDTWEALMNNKCYIIDKCGTATTSTPKNEQLLIHNTIEDKFIWYSTPLFLTVQNVKQYLNNNPFEIIYQLATPVYEEVKCDLSKLALEGYDHGTLFYNSNIPVTTQFYDFNVNIKDMLIPNETYYITFIADRVKDITINLSGVQVNYKTSMGYNKVPVQLGDVVNTNFSMDSRGVELSDLMVSTSTSLIYVKDMNDVCIYDEASNKYSITITSTSGNESDKRVILLDYPLLRLNKDIYDKLYYNNKDSRYRIDKKVFKHKFTNDQEYNKYAAETNDTYYSSFVSLNETIKDYVVITNEKVKTVKVEDDKYYFKIKWSDLGVSDKTEVNGNQGMKDFFNNNEVYLYYATDGFVEIVDGLRRQTLKMYQPETTINFLGNTTTTVTIVIPKKNI